MRGLISDNLKSLRESKGLTRKELAEKVFYTDRAILYYEKGQKMPRVDILMAMADYFGVTTDYLLGRERKPCRETPEELRHASFY